MLFLEDLEPILYVKSIRNKTQVFSEMMSLSMSSASCGEARSEDCRDDAEALSLKLVAIAVILIAGVAGVALPLVGRKRRFLRTDGNLFVIAKAFAAGVILATGFVHMLPGGSKALTNKCLPHVPWAKFSFAEFVAMVASLGTLLIDFVGTQFYERRHEAGGSGSGSGKGISPIEEPFVGSVESGIITGGRKAVGEDAGGGMHIVGMHAHAAAHRHSHPHGKHSCEGAARESGHVGHAHRSSWDDSDGEGPSAHVRHVIVSQILELGIVSHSVIIGLSLGVSQSPCTIRPLIAALSFHQFFEGFALGGCISQAQFKILSATLMACFFAITTPAGIGIGIAVSSFYNPDSARALVVEGMLDSVSAGILVYMALVDLIAADFLSRRMSCNFRLQITSYFALFLGAGLMSLLAIWA
ncbi:hypothetical protein AAC387_Pa02g2798 [Persea americana]